MCGSAANDVPFEMRRKLNPSPDPDFPDSSYILPRAANRIPKDAIRMKTGRLTCILQGERSGPAGASERIVFLRTHGTEAFFP
jgi:hypothetical protein